MILFIYILSIFISILVNVNSIDVSNKSQFIELVTSSDENEVEIVIKDEIKFSDNEFADGSINKLVISGDIENSKLNFGDFRLSFSSTIKEIIIKDIQLTGKIVFNDNERVTFNKVKLSGTLSSSYNKTDNEYIKMENVEFIADTKVDEIYECINLSGNLEIVNSFFTGSSYCINRIFKFDGLNKYNFSINNSHFDGDYKTSCLEIENGKYVKIENSIFNNGFCNEKTRGGGAISISYSNAFIQNSSFTNNLSEISGGSLYLMNNYNFTANNLQIYNTTSYNSGSMAFVKSENKSDNYITYFKNIYHKSTGNIKNCEKMITGGLILGADTYANIKVDNYYCEELINKCGSGTLFILSDNAKIYIKNLTGNNIKGNRNDGILLHSFNSKKNAIFNIYNYTLSNIHQTYSKPSSALIWIAENTEAYLEKGKLTNFTGTHSHLINLSESTIVNIKDLEVDNFFSEIPIELIAMGVNSRESATTIFDELKLNNIKSQGAIFKTNGGRFTVKNSEIKNVHLCYKEGNCNGLLERNEPEILKAGTDSEIIMYNTTFDNFYGDFGFISFYKTDLNIYNTTFSNSYFKNGLVYVDPYDRVEHITGNYMFYDTNFINLKSEKGSVADIVSYTKGNIFNMEFYDCTFKNNYASKFGGVIFSISEDMNGNVVKILNSKFINNTAFMGNILYSLNRNCEIYIDNTKISDLNLNDIVTNPTRLRINKIKDKSIDINNISLNSGEYLPDGISCSIYDDYNHLIKFGDDPSKIDIEDIVFFSIESNDTYNVDVISQTSYCWNHTCQFPSVKIYGNPGTYLISLVIKTFGLYYEFPKSKIDITVKINECNSTFLNKITDNTRFKTCYKPVCEPECPDGKEYCIDNNICYCKNHKTGNHCDKFYKFERINLLDYILRGISSFLILLTVILIFLVYKNRNEPLIKGGSIDFLIIILIGSIINLLYIFSITTERTVEICYIQYLLNNIGFALVFGSIFVKTLRIYKIFRQVKKQKVGIKKVSMYAIVIGIILFHLLMATYWTITKKVKIESNEITLENKEKQYFICQYSSTKNLSILFNLIILSLGSMLSYFIRHVKENFKENLVVPVYVYLLFTLFTELINDLDDMSIIVQDIFSSLGTFLNTFVILFYLYIIKLYTVYSQKRREVKYGSITNINNNVFLNNNNNNNSFNEEFNKKYNYELKKSYSNLSISKKSKNGTNSSGVNTPLLKRSNSNLSNGNISYIARSYSSNTLKTRKNYN